jgi:hypothetical protein
MVRALSAFVAALAFLTLPALAGDLPILPDPKLTPGAVLTTDAATVCKPGYAKSVRHTPGKLKEQVYRVYGITKEQQVDGSHFEIDHIISLELDHMSA